MQGTTHLQRTFRLPAPSSVPLPRRVLRPTAPLSRPLLQSRRRRGRLGWTSPPRGVERRGNGDEDGGFRKGGGGRGRRLGRRRGGSVRGAGVGRGFGAAAEAVAQAVELLVEPGRELREPLHAARVVRGPAKLCACVWAGGLPGQRQGAFREKKRRTRVTAF